MPLSTKQQATPRWEATGLGGAVFLPPRATRRLTGEGKVRDAVNVDSESGAAVAALLRSALATEHASAGTSRGHIAVTLTDLRRLTALLRPICGTAAHVLVNRAAGATPDRDALVDGLAAEMADPALHDAFRVAARVALALR